MKKVLSALTVAGAALGVGFAAPAAATPVETGCPSGFAVLAVSDLAAMGYLHAPQRADSAGNGDGTVCGLPMPEGYTVGLINSIDLHPVVDVVYLFVDNDKPARRGG